MNAEGGVADTRERLASITERLQRLQVLCAGRVARQEALARVSLGAQLVERSAKPRELDGLACREVLQLTRVTPQVIELIAVGAAAGRAHQLPVSEHERLEWAPTKALV